MSCSEMTVCLSDFSPHIDATAAINAAVAQAISSGLNRVYVRPGQYHLESAPAIIDGCVTIEGHHLADTELIVDYDGSGLWFRSNVGGRLKDISILKSVGNAGAGVFVQPAQGQVCGLFEMDHVKVSKSHTGNVGWANTVSINGEPGQAIPPGARGISITSCQLHCGSSNVLQIWGGKGVLVVGSQLYGGVLVGGTPQCPSDNIKFIGTDIQGQLYVQPPPLTNNVVWNKD